MTNKKKTLKSWGRYVGREGMAKAALKAVEQCDGSYIGVMQLAGRLKAIAEAAECDDYWKEQVHRGYQAQFQSADFYLSIVEDIQDNTRTLTEEWESSIKSGIDNYWLDLAYQYSLVERRISPRKHCQVYEYRRSNTYKKERE